MTYYNRHTPRVAKERLKYLRAEIAMVHAEKKGLLVAHYTNNRQQQKKT